MTLKFDGWPCKTIGHLFYATSSFVQHFVAIGEFKLELQSGKAHFFGIDILCLTESWINDNISDLLCLKSATPSGYSFISVPRKSGRGGGLVLIYKSSIRVRLKPSLNDDSFESKLAEVVYDHIQTGMVLVYRPPSENFSTFLTEFGQMVIPLLIENSSRILCLGDFNIHVDQESDLRAKAFNSPLSEIGLLQHVCFPTHEKGHTLDLVLTDVRHPPLIREPSGRFTNMGLSADCLCPKSQIVIADLGQTQNCVSLNLS